MEKVACILGPRFNLMETKQTVSKKSVYGVWWGVGGKGHSLGMRAESRGLGGPMQAPEPRS